MSLATRPLGQISVIHFEDSQQQPHLGFRPALWMLQAPILGLLLMLCSVLYTYGVVVAALAAVEAPDTHVYMSSSVVSEHEKHANTTEALHEEAILNPAALYLRKTKKRLREHDGYWYRYRGLNIALTYQLVKIFLFQIAPLQERNISGWFLYNIFIKILLSSLHIALLHTIISRRSSDYFYQRIPGVNTLIKIAPIAVLSSIATSAVFYLHLGIAKYLGTFRGLVDLYLIAICLVSTAILYFGVVAPSRAIYIRVAASLLPEQDEPIVPFDRTFGGKVVAVALGGNGKLSILDAWSSFNWPSRVRYFKILGIVFGLEIVGSFLLFVYDYIDIYNTMPMIHFIA